VSPRVLSVVLTCLLAAVGIAASPAVLPQGHAHVEPTPRYILARCRASKRLRLACPHVLPRMAQPSPHWETTVCLAAAAGCQGLTWDDLNLVDAGDGNRPPLWSHVTVYAGDLTRAFGFRVPTHGSRVANLNGLFARVRTRPIFLGAHVWGGRHGTVVLAPDYPDGGEQGGHLIFLWREAGVSCALGLHGWEPLAQAFATLKAMVESI
jgi:hypothetical protein